MDGGRGRPGVEHAGVRWDLRPLTDDLTRGFIADGGLEAAARAVAAGRLPVLDVSALRFGPPVADPGAVVCIGMNYAAHAAESGSAPPQWPVVFFKHPGSVVGPDDDVQMPRGASKVDWEVELAVVVGRDCRYLDSPKQALEHVAGYAISNDVSERAFQLEQSGGQWSKGKSCDTFNPLGPFLVLASEVPDPQALRLRSFVNGEPRQDSSTADMIFPVGYLLWHLSQYMTLRPGDIVNTGTPEGVALSGRFPYLQPGDVMTVEIDGLGRQQQTVIAAP
jgi:2-keto-4-pentenoate hydratase/2-oxohepta-3-ene-1,7-dioic acid hydratase in catechol pathway